MLPRIRPVYAALAAVCLAVLAPERAPGQEVPDAAELVRRAAEQQVRYVEVFQNLLAEESKSFEVFDDDGEVDKRRNVRSTFIIYRLSRGKGELAEFRNVTHVDGKNVERSSDRAQRFFERLAESEDSVKELERINDESFRFDPDVRIAGLTLFQAVALAENIAPAMEFRFAGKDTIDGHEVYVLAYRQVRASEFIRVNRGDHPDATKTGLSYELGEGPKSGLNERMQGRLWLDAATFRIRREVREVTVQPADFAAPALVSTTDSVYRDSDFGILTPKRIDHVLYRLKRRARVTVKDIRASFEYTNFTKPDVEVRSGDVKQPGR